jgi:hypothetical protein
MLRLLPIPEGFLCEPHKVCVRTMISQVIYPEGCEECIRMVFAEALEQALARTKEIVAKQGYQIHESHS